MRKQAVHQEHENNRMEGALEAWEKALHSAKPGNAPKTKNRLPLAS